MDARNNVRHIQERSRELAVALGELERDLVLGVIGADDALERLSSISVQCSRLRSDLSDASLSFVVALPHCTSPPSLPYPLILRSRLLPELEKLQRQALSQRPSSSHPSATTQPSILPPQPIRLQRPTNNSNNNNNNMAPSSSSSSTKQLYSTLLSGSGL